MLWTEIFWLGALLETKSIWQDLPCGVQLHKKYQTLGPKYFRSTF